ncbi:ATP-binding protein [Streptosporangium lutulentum]
MRAHRERGRGAQPSPEPISASKARRFIRSTLTGWGLSSIADNTELMVSELVANAIEHGHGQVELRLLRGPTLLCEVSDHSPDVPVMREASTTDDTGRGLYLINWLAHRWGSRMTPKGKIVWVEQRLPWGPPLRGEGSTAGPSAHRGAAGSHEVPAAPRCHRVQRIS